MSLWSLLKVCLLSCNAVAILDKRRFLQPTEERFEGREVVHQALNFLNAAQYLRPVLIPLNFVCIFVEVLFGS